MNLLIARSNFNSYSETFIEEKIKQLATAEVLYEGWLPSRTYSGKSIYAFPLALLIVRGTLRNLFPVFFKKIFCLSEVVFHFSIFHFIYLILLFLHLLLKITSKKISFTMQNFSKSTEIY